MRDLSLHMLDIIQNSITACASIICIHISADSQRQNLLLEIQDNGVGMDIDFAVRAADPFTTSRATRKVGLGIPLLKESALKCNGKFNLESELNRGTKLTAEFQMDHIDRLPIGDIGETLIAAISANPLIQFVMELDSKKGEFRLDTADVSKTLGSLSINEYEVLKWLKEYIDEGIKNIFGGVLNEVYS
jgi:hypothetical protein